METIAIGGFNHQVITGYRQFRSPHYQVIAATHIAAEKNMPAARMHIQKGGAENMAIGIKTGLDITHGYRRSRLACTRICHGTESHHFKLFHRLFRILPGIEW